MKVTSNKTVSFSKLGWGINAGETRELPEDKEAQKVILAHPAIKEAGASQSTGRKADTSKGDSEK